MLKMGKIHIFFVVAIAVLVGAISIGFVFPRRDRNADSEQLLVGAPSEYSVATIDSFGESQITFQLENKSKHDIEIDRVLPDCGCMAVVSSDRLVIAPGQRIPLVLVLDHRKVPTGEFQKRVIVQFRSTEAPSKHHVSSLSVSGRRRESTYLLLYPGRIRTEVVSGGETTVNVFARGSPDLLRKIASPIAVNLSNESESHFVEVDQPDSRSDSAVSLPIEIQFKSSPNGKEGLRRGSIVFVKAGTPIASLPFEVRVEPVISVERSYVLLRTGMSGDRVRFVGPRGFQPRNARVEADELMSAGDVRIVAGEGGEGWLEINRPREEIKGEYFVRVRVWLEGVPQPLVVTVVVQKF